MEPPPRQTSKIARPDECIIRKGKYGRAHTALECDTKMKRIYAEKTCSSAITQSSSVKHVYHSHKNNTRIWNETDTSSTGGNDMLCFHCCHSFHREFHGGYVVPTSFDAYEKIFVVEGNFCSLACAKRDILERPANSQTMSLFIKLCFDVYGVNVAEIVAAPPRLALKCFGGYLDIETFRGNTKAISINQSPFINTCQIFEEKAVIDFGRKNNKGMVTSSLPQGSVRGLRRPKLKNGESVLIMDEDAIERAHAAKSKYELFLEAKKARNQT